MATRKPKTSAEKMRKVNSRRKQTSTERLRGRAASADKQGRATKPARSKNETRNKTKQVQAKAKMANKTKGAPKDLGPRGSTGTGANRVKSAPTVKGNTSTATGRGNYQGKHGPAVKKTAVAKTKRKMAANLAKRAGGKLGGVAGAAATVASDKKKADRTARRKAYSRATKKPLNS